MHHGRTHRVIENPVLVGAAQRIKARMKPFGHFTGPFHGNVIGQKGIDTANPAGRSTPKGRSNAHHLVRSMHTAIGTPRADGGHRNRKETAQSAFQNILYRIAFGLGLPAKIVLTGVLDAKRYSLHGLFRITAVRHGSFLRFEKAIRTRVDAVLRYRQEALHAGHVGLRHTHRLPYTYVL